MNNFAKNNLTTNNLNKLKMKKVTTTIKALVALLVVAAIVTFTSCSNNGNGSVSKSEIDSLRNQIAMLTLHQYLFLGCTRKYCFQHTNVFRGIFHLRLHLQILTVQRQRLTLLQSDLLAG